MHYLIPSLGLIVSGLVINDGVITAFCVENGAWHLCSLHDGTRAQLRDAFSADNRVYAVPRGILREGYNAVFAWFDALG